jgi:hypothetical protein
MTILSKCHERFSCFSQLTSSGLGVKPGPDEENHGFDLADMMEQGVATERAPCTTAQNVTRELTVHHSEGSSKYVLRSEDNKAMLIAQERGMTSKFDLFVSCDGVNRTADVISQELNTERHFDIFVASNDGEACTEEPSFCLTHSKNSLTWQLQSSHCEKCEYYRSPNSRNRRGGGAQSTLLRVHQKSVSVGGGKTMGITVDVPADGSVWCECCGNSPSTGRSLASRKPRWSAALKSLTMDFGTRCKEGSPKNFQLLVGNEPRVGKHHERVFEFGKMSADMYCLDVASPLGTVQAFAIALTTVTLGYK